MIIYINYNKQTQNITVSGDIEDLAPVELNLNTVVDGPENLSFEVAVNNSNFRLIDNEDELLINTQETE